MLRVSQLGCRRTTFTYRRLCSQLAKAKKPPLTTRIKNHAVHFWRGTKQFGYDIKVAWPLLYRKVIKDDLNWEEKRQLAQATADMFKMVPFLIITLVPFMEVLFPILFLIFGPKMLPSQFQSESRLSNYRKQRLKAKVTTSTAMMEWYVDSLSAMTVELQKDATQNRFANLMAGLEEKVTKIQAGEIDNFTEEELKLFSLLSSESFLGKLERKQLQQLCKLLGVPNSVTLATAPILRSAVLYRLHKLKREDVEIHKLGVKNIPLKSLQDACRVRGIRVDEHDVEGLQRQLGSWLVLSVEKNVSGLFLIMVQALSINQVCEVASWVTSELTEDIDEQLTAAFEADLREDELEDLLEEEQDKEDKKPELEVIGEDLQDFKDEIEEIVQKKLPTSQGEFPEITDAETTSIKRMAEKAKSLLNKVEKQVAELALDADKALARAASGTNAPYPNTTDPTTTSTSSPSPTNDETQPPQEQNTQAVGSTPTSANTASEGATEVEQGSETKKSGTESIYHSTETTPSC
eukprot:TRINITY_DN54189_c0_g1_i1.p1 TRINITY_DN54189_c0_g1~~TRINITY_DN54189_c0_g1_i1.p1  ORF type:complete len:520 (+),score=31.67 TRINITY_DN54189_c0_g1_i1:60-1619(+)